MKKSKEEDKPIFLSIGYSACHWCHRFREESFEDESTAALMNEHFICIKVDREQRPDLDAIYMAAVVALTGSGGWPMSVFLTPDLRPFYGGTYYPPVPRHNLPSFRDVLASLADAWQNRRDEIHRVGAQLAEHLARNVSVSAQAHPIAFTAELLEAAEKNLLDSYDWGYGGWGAAPKFPQPMTIEFLLARHLAPNPALERRGESASLHALRAMSRGGMYDVVGGGFSRYSTDNFWRVPHFEKMLYDNALLVRAYLHAWQLTGDASFRRVVEETLDFVAREMTHPEGGFHSSLDADSEGEEGRFYVWRRAEIREILEKPDAEFFEAAYGLTEHGNWEGKTVLQRALDDASLAARFSGQLSETGKPDPEAVAAKLAGCHEKLLAARSRRVRPGTDDKILAAWNGLMLAACAEAARVLDDPFQQNRYHEMATRNAEFLLTHLRHDGKLHRSWRDGQTTDEVFLEDYAALILGLLELYQTDFNSRWFSAALELADEMIQRFTDPDSGGFFDTPSGAESLLVRPRDIQDNATPSGNALAVEALLNLSALTGRGDFRDQAVRALGQVAEMAARYPTAFARWLSAAAFAQAQVKQVAIVGEVDGAPAQALIRAVRARYRPNVVVAAGGIPQKEDAPALLRDRPLVNGKPAAYVCEGFTCLQPVTSPEDLLRQL